MSDDVFLENVCDKLGVDARVLNADEQTELTQNCRVFFIESVKQLRDLLKTCEELEINLLQVIDSNRGFKFLNLKALIQCFPPPESSEDIQAKIYRN